MTPRAMPHQCLDERPPASVSRSDGNLAAACSLLLLLVVIALRQRMLAVARTDRTRRVLHGRCGRQTVAALHVLCLHALERLDLNARRGVTVHGLGLRARVDAEIGRAHV